MSNSNTHFNPHTEWSKIRDTIEAELRRTPISEFEKAFGSPDAKTEFNGQLLEAVAERLGYHRWTEFLRCDFAIVNRQKIPVAFIESENYHGTAEDEIDKLCAVSAPVKILMLSCSWSDSERAVFSPVLEGADCTSGINIFGEDCVYAIIVAEWGRGQPEDEVLRYLFDVIDHRGVEIERREVVVPNSAPVSANGQV